MRNAKPLLAIGLAAAAVTACGKARDSSDPDRNMSLEEPMPGGIPANADVETLPADESSTTPSNELQNGFVPPETNDSSAGNAE